MKAVGTYVHTLRKAQHLSRGAVGAAAGTNGTYVWRVEVGEMESPGIELLSKIITAVKGRGDHLLKLMTDENPTDELAKALAHEALTAGEQQQVESLLVTDAGTRALIEAVLEVNQDPILGARLQGYLDSLRGGATPPEPELPKTLRKRRRAE